MLFNDLLPGLLLTARDYALTGYKHLDRFQENPIKVFRRGDGVEIFVLKSDHIEDIKGTFFDTGLEKDKALFEKFKTSEFYFTVVMKDDNIENIMVPEEIFLTSDECVSFAKKYLKIYEG